MIDALDLSVPKRAAVTPTPSSESSNATPALDDRRLTFRRSKLSKNRREAKSHRTEPQKPPRLELRVEQRQWGSQQKRKTVSLPPKPSHFVVVDDEVGDTPVCGIDLGPFLSWLSCMPAIPEQGN